MFGVENMWDDGAKKSIKQYRSKPRSLNRIVFWVFKHDLNTFSTFSLNITCLCRIIAIVLANISFIAYIDMYCVIFEFERIKMLFTLIRIHTSMEGDCKKNILICVNRR